MALKDEQTGGFGLCRQSGQRAGEINSKSDLEVYDGGS